MKRIFLLAAVLLALAGYVLADSYFDPLTGKVITVPKSPTFESITVTGSATMGTSASGLVVTSDADGVVLTSADWGKTIWMTGAGEVQLPDGTASDIGKYLIVIVRDASEQVEIALTDATELFVRQDGTAQTAGNELNMATSAMSKITVAYMETGKWYVLSGSGTDGGAAD